MICIHGLSFEKDFVEMQQKEGSRHLAMSPCYSIVSA